MKACLPTEIFCSVLEKLQIIIHIWFYHIDIYRSVILDVAIFTSHDYFVVQGWIRTMLLHQTNMLLAGPNVHCFFKFFPGVVRYFHSDNNILPCLKPVAVLDVLHHCIVTRSPHFHFHISKLCLFKLSHRLSLM